MAVSLTHAFRSPKRDGSDATLVQPSHWNADHELEMTGPSLVGRVTGTGTAEEIPLSANMAFVGGALATTLEANLSSESGASLVGVSGGGTVQDYIDAAPITFIDAGAYLNADGTANDMGGCRAWMAAGVAVSAAGGRPVMRAVGTFRLTVDYTYNSAYAERKALVAQNMHNAVFDCGDATWLFDSSDVNTGYANVFNIENSDNVSGDLGTVDWLKKPFAQGVITKGADYIDIALDSGFSPTFDEAQRVEVYSRSGINQNKILQKPLAGADVPGFPVTYPSAGVMRVSFAGDAPGLAYLATLTNGEIVVVTYRMYGADAFRFVQCRNIDIKARVITTGGMCWRLNDCTDVKVDVSAAARTDALISATADGLHTESCRGFLEINGSVRHTGDDPLNIASDSFVVVSVSAPRTFTISVTYPYILPRVGDALVGVNDAGIATALGKIATFNAGLLQVVMDTDLPVGFATTWQVSNTNAQPFTTFASTFIAEKCRGHVRIQAPSVSGRVRATDLTGSVAAEYLPFYYGEGYPPNALTLDVEAVRCATIMSMGGAVMVQAIQIDGGGYGSAGAISKPSINAVVRETRNSAVFMAGVSYACVTLVSDRCCQNPDTGSYTYADKQVSLINCDNINFPHLVELGATPGAVGSGATTNVRYGNKLNYT